MAKIGSALKQREQRYSATQDDKGTWRILDTWHPSLQELEPDDEIPDNSPAILVLTDGAFIALVKEATAKGILQNATLGGAKPGSGVEEWQAEKRGLEDRIALLQSELSEAHRQPERSEGFLLKEKVVDSLTRLAFGETIGGKA